MFGTRGGSYSNEQMCYCIVANCPYLIGTVPILTQEKVGKRAILPHVPIFAKICL